MRADREEGGLTAAPGALRGLFVGIDHYDSVKIKDLRNAHRDAATLWALFSDTYDQEAALLRRRQLTLEGILSALNTLVETCAEDDLVVFAFSGHASERYLHVKDTDPDDLENTALPLARLAEILRSLRARRVVVVLDCCDSDQPVLTVGLDREVPGDERFLISAAAPGEQAIEGRNIGHGLLTDRLCRALTGTGKWTGFEVLPLAEVLRSVAQEVREAASALFGHVQRAAARVHGGEHTTLPVLRPGHRYSNVHPGERGGTATDDPRSLIPLGIPARVVDTWLGRGIDKLSDVQVRAVNDGGVLGDGNALVLAPTGSGKSLVADMAMIRVKLDGGQSVFLAPSRALVNERYAELVEVYGDWMRIVRATGQSIDQVGDVLAGRFDIAVLTFEMLARLALTRRRVLGQLALIVVDEVHHVTDPVRGPTLELLLTLAMNGLRTAGRTPRVLALSAAVDNTGGLEFWLDGATLVREWKRPVPLDEHVVFPGGSLPSESSAGLPSSDRLARRSRWKSDEAAIADLVASLVRRNHRVIVFRNTRAKVLECGRAISAILRRPVAPPPIHGLESTEPSMAGRELVHCLAHGVGLHNGDLSPAAKSVVEQLFKDPESPVRVVVATTTLAHGVNLPATAVVVAELHHEDDLGKTPYSVATYRNIIGRAGRLGLVDRGLAITVTSDKEAAKAVMDNYVTAKIPPLRSALLSRAADLDTLVLRAIAAMQAYEQAPPTIPSVVEFLQRSFAAHVERVEGGEVALVERMVGEVAERLCQDELVTVHERYIHLTERGEVFATGSLSVRSATALAAALRRVHSPVTRFNEASLIMAAQLTDELGAVPLHGGKSKAELRRRMDRHGVPPSLTEAAIQGVPADAAVRRLRRAFACMAWISGQEQLLIEQDIVNSKTPPRNMGSLRQVTARTADVIDTVVKIVRMRWPEAEFDRRLTRLGARLEYGVPNGLVPIAAALGSRLDRSQYRALVEAGLTDHERILAASDATLSSCLDDDDVVRDVKAAASNPEHDDIFDLEDLGDLAL